MTSWMKERDRLVQQTMAFVQGVAAQRPVSIDLAEVKSPEPVAAKHVVAKPVVSLVAAKPAEPVLKIPTSDASLVEAEALMSLIAKSLPSLRPEPAAPVKPSVPAFEPSVLEPIARPTAAEAVPAKSSQPYANPLRSNAPVYVPVPKRPSQFALPEREMIAQRVSIFRAGQLRLIQERENHYAMVQAKIRASLGNDFPA